MGDSKKQWSLLISRGLVQEDQLQWAWSQLQQGVDLCSVLVRTGLISPEIAEQIRREESQSRSLISQSSLNNSLGNSCAQGSMSPAVSAESIFAALSKVYLEAKDLEPLFAPHAQHVFQRLGKLGEGGMGIVYRIQDQRLGRQAAMKVLRRDAPAQQKSLLSRFIREARLTAALDHPSVPAVYELGVNHDREQYMLMRVIEGETLKERIDNFHQDGGQNSKTLRELLDILLKVSETVAYSHFKKIIHRDLKPSNIMVGQFGEVMLMDWGLARKLGGSDSEDSCLIEEGKELSEDIDATQVGSVIGTFGYMPPEQASGENVDERADVFALGAILTTILSGDPPVLGKTAINRMTATIKGEIEVPSDRCSVPPELDCLAGAALAAEPEQRLDSAHQFVLNLKAYLLDEPLPLYQYSVFERAKRHIQCHPTLYVGLSFLAISALGATLSALELSRLEGQRQLENQRRLLTEEKNRRINIEKSELDKQKKSLTKENQVYELINKAEGIAKRAGPKTKVLELVEKALALSGYSETAYITAARVFETRHLWREGIEILGEGIEKNPPGYEIYFRIYLIEEMREQWIRNRVAVKGGTEKIDLNSKAFEKMSQVVEESGQKNEFTLFSAAQRAFKAQDYAKALNLLNMAEEKNKNMAALYIQRARVQLAMKNEAAALIDLKTSLIIKPRLYSWFTLGRIYYQRKQYDNAYRAFKNCIRDQSKLRLQALFMMAEIAIVRRDFDDGLLRLTELIKEQPKNLDYRQRRATLYFYKDHFSNCIRDYSFILASRPNDAESLYWRAACYFSIGQKSRGLNDFKKALSIEPKNVAARTIPMKFPWLKDALR